LRLPAVSDDALRVGFAVVLALFLPFFGLILSGFFAWQAHNEGRSGVRNILRP
jgi:hypothetical protein